MIGRLQRVLIPFFLAVVVGTAFASPSLTANPSSVNFGTVTVGSNGVVKVTLSANGGGKLSITSITVSGAALSVIGPNLPLTLSGSQSTAASVTFAPTTTGSFAGTLVVQWNYKNNRGAAAQNTMKLAVAGTASATSTGSSGTTTSASTLTANPSSDTFGTVPVGSSASVHQTVTNAGADSLTISQVAVTGAGFAVSGIAPPLALAGGQSYTFTVTYAPTTSGSATGAVNVTSNAQNPTLAVALSGSATATGSLALSPTSASFGDVVVGSTATQTGTLTASGASVTISSVTPSGPEFTVSGIALPLTLAAGASASFSVTFAPAATGSLSETLTFASNASNPSLAEPVSGSGVVQHSSALSWTGSAGSVAGYNVYRSSVAGGPYQKITPALTAATSYNDTAVAAGLTYYYVVTAVDTTGMESGYSAQVQAIIPTP